jgi:hypothetical protein
MSSRTDRCWRKWDTRIESVRWTDGIMRIDERGQVEGAKVAHDTHEESRKSGKIFGEAEGLGAATWPDLNRCLIRPSDRALRTGGCAAGKCDERKSKLDGRLVVIIRDIRGGQRAVVRGTSSQLDVRARRVSVADREARSWRIVTRRRSSRAVVVALALSSRGSFSSPSLLAAAIWLDDRLPLPHPLLLLPVDRSRRWRRWRRRRRHDDVDVDDSTTRSQRLTTQRRVGGPLL